MKLALFAKGGTKMEILNGPPKKVTYPPEPLHEEPVDNHTQATERDRKIRNEQVKVKWQNRCKKIDEIGILCGDKPLRSKGDFTSLSLHRNRKQTLAFSHRKRTDEKYFGA